MPTTYIRKSAQGMWTQDQLHRAVEEIKNKKMGINEAARYFSIPARTLRRRLQTGNYNKLAMGRCPLLGNENEMKLANHLKTLQKRGFPATRNDLREIAYNFAERLKVKHSFKNRKASYDWLHSFLYRHPDLSLRKAEGVSASCAVGLNHEVVNAYFNMLGTLMAENNLFQKPANIYNMDETGLQLNNKTGFVIAEKGSKNIHSLTSGEKGETITIIACCNAEGAFLPPACIFKGKYKKDEYQDHMPPGTVIYMSQKSAYINSEIFFTWLKDHFIPRKLNGKVLLILDGHTSHCNISTLELAEENNVIIICLPSHTTHFLQPLDRAVFRSLKLRFNIACNNWVKTHPSRKITRYQFGLLLSEAWVHAATTSNAISAFKSTGIFPFNRNAIPDDAFLVGNDNPPIAQPTEETTGILPFNSNDIAIPDGMFLLDNDNPPMDETYHSTTPSPTPGTSSTLNEIEDVSQILITITPGKMLQEISPISVIKTEVVRKRSKNIAAVLTDASYIKQCKEKLSKTSKANNAKINKKINKTNKKKEKTLKKRNNKTNLSCSDVSYFDNEESEEVNTKCIGCGENYTETKRKDDWIQCLHCKKWLHDGCTIYNNICDICAKVLCIKKEKN